MVDQRAQLLKQMSQDTRWIFGAAANEHGYTFHSAGLPCLTSCDFSVRLAHRSASPAAIGEEVHPLFTPSAPAVQQCNELKIERRGEDARGEGGEVWGAAEDRVKWRGEGKRGHVEIISKQNVQMLKEERFDNFLIWEYKKQVVDSPFWCVYTTWWTKWQTHLFTSLPPRSQHLSLTSH